MLIGMDTFWEEEEEEEALFQQVVGHISYENKVDVLDWVLHLKWTPIFEWCMVGWESKNKDTCVKNILDFVFKIC